MMKDFLGQELAEGDFVVAPEKHHLKIVRVIGFTKQKVKVEDSKSHNFYFLRDGHLQEILRSFVQTTVDAHRVTKVPTHLVPLDELPHPDRVSP